MNRSYGSGNAYKYYDNYYDNYYDAQRIRKTEYGRETGISKTNQNSRYIKKAEIERRKIRAYNKALKLERILAVSVRTAAVFIIAGILVYRYVLINELNMTANKLKSEYNNIVAENQAIQSEIDSAIDLKKLQEIATTRLGMVRPDSDQVFYVETESSNYGEKVDKKKSKNNEALKDNADGDDSSLNAVTGSIIRSVTGE